LHYGNKIFWKTKKWKINFLWFFFNFQNFGNFWNHKIGEKKRKPWCRGFEFKVWIWMFKAWFQGGFSGSKCQKGATLHRFFSMPLFDLQTSNLLLVCQWNNILFIYLFIFLYLHQV
jgi:hypothetical protein